MGKAQRIGSFILRKASLYLAFKVFLTFFVLAYAATIVVTNRTYQASIGAAVNFTNNLKSMDKGLVKASSSISAAGSSCSNNVTFTGSPGVANTAITVGDMVYVFGVNSTGTTPSNTCFTVNLVIKLSGSEQSYTVYIATDSSPTNDETIDCKFDIGTSLPTSPYSFKVTVQ